MTYLAPPPAPRRPHNTRPIHRLRWPWIPWFIGASSTLIGLGIFTLFADRRVSSLHDIGLDGRMLWQAKPRPAGSGTFSMQRLLMVGYEGGAAGG